MSPTTPLLGLPYLDAAQAQKHVIHNEALRMLDAVVQLAVADRNLAAPPAEPVNGDRYIVAAGASGAWAGRVGQVAAWQDDAWAFFAPMPGWLVWVADEGLLMAWDGSGWVTAGGGGGGGGGGESSPLFGVNTTADGTNRLSVKSDAVLLSHDDVTPGTGDMRVVMNKADVSNTASFLFQSDSSGRAEIGLAGDNKLHVKVSASGMAWTEAMIVDPATGYIGFGAPTPSAKLEIVGVSSPAANSWIKTRSEYAASNAGGGIILQHNNASSLPVTNDRLGYFFFGAVDGSANRLGAGLAAFAEGNYSATSLPTYFSFETAPSGSTSRVERLRITSTGHTIPGADNAYTLGQSGQRWSAVWAATGTIQTSDARDKDIVGSLDFAGGLVDAVDPVLFRWKVGGNEVRESETDTTTDDEGNTIPALEIVSKPGARIHAGFLAQDIKAAMDTAGVDFGAWGLEDKDAPDSRQFMRPDQLIAVLWAALKETRGEVEAMKQSLSNGS